VLENEMVLLTAARMGSQNGLLGLRMGGILYFRDQAPEITLEALVVRPERAEAEKAAAKATSSFPGYQAGVLPPIGIHNGLGTEESGGLTGPSTKGTEETGESITVGRTHRLSIRAMIPWDKVSQVFSGVILPLKSAGAIPEITLEIHAHSDGGFDRTTLESKVKETLHQIGSEIEKWEEE
jgi:hypothetical protein